MKVCVRLASTRLPHRTKVVGILIGSGGRYRVTGLGSFPVLLATDRGIYPALLHLAA